MQACSIATQELLFLFQPWVRLLRVITVNGKVWYEKVMGQAPGNFGGTGSGKGLMD